MVPDLEACLVRVCDPKGVTKGTGFVVSDYLAVTCAHVVDACAVAPGGQVRVVFLANGQRCAAEVLHDYWRPSDKDDIAVLRLNPEGGRLPGEVVPAALGSADNCDGHPMRTAGFAELPGRYEFTEAEGKLLKLVPHPLKHRMLRMDARPIVGGMSGAPVLDLDTRRVVGMVSEFLRDTPLQWATTSDTLTTVCHDLCLRPPQAVEEYLAAVQRYCASLPYLTLHDMRAPRTLDEVYVPLRLRPRPRGDKNPEGGEKLASLSLAEVLQRHDPPHILIQGAPGTGKSTLLRQLAEHAWNAPQEIGLDSKHIPMPISLRSLASTAGSVEERISQVLAGKLPLVRTFPNGFFEDWPKQSGMPWLIMLDALDEVPAGKLRELMDWLSRWLNTIRWHRIVITYRLTDYQTYELKTDQYCYYELLPFTPEQTEELAHKWLGDAKDSFMKELGRVNAVNLLDTPLLLTIAAKVFLEDEQLPERRSVLIDKCIDIFLQEAMEQGLDAEWKGLSSRPKDVLANLALMMTNQPQETSITDLRRAASDYLSDPSLHITVDVDKLVELLARRSGIFVRRNETYDFVHPIFGEYLAAYALVENWGKNARAEAFTFFKDSWRTRSVQLSLFVLSILSDRGEDVSDLVRIVTRGTLFNPAKRREGIYFQGLILVEGITIENELTDLIVGRMLKLARRLRQPRHYVDLIDLIKVLGRLHGYARATEGLLTLGAEDPWWRLEIALILGLVGRIEEAVQVYLALASVPRFSIWRLQRYRKEAGVRLHAAEALGELGRTDEATQAYMALAHVYTITIWGRDFPITLAEPYYRLQAAEALVELGRIDEAIPAYLELIDDVGILIYDVIQALGQLGRLTTSSEKRDEIGTTLMKLRGKAEGFWGNNIRDCVCEALRYMGQVEELMVMARDTSEHDATRATAIEALIRIYATPHDHDPLKQRDLEERFLQKTLLFFDYRLRCPNFDRLLEYAMRLQSAKAQEETSQADQIASILLELFRDPAIDYLNAEQAVGLLAELERTDDLLMLARDAAVRVELCVEAARALGRLGRQDDAAQSLLMLARNQAVENSYDHDYLFLDYDYIPISVLAKLGRRTLAHGNPIKVLAELGRVDELRTLAHDTTVSEGIRLIAAEALEQLGREEEAVAMYMTLASDVSVGHKTRKKAICALERLGRKDQTAAGYWLLARDSAVFYQDRFEAAEALHVLGRNDAAAAIYLALANQFWNPEEAIVALERMGRTEELTVVYTAVAQNVLADRRTREKAIAALERLGKTNEVVAVYTAVAKNVFADRRTREKAIAALQRTEKGISALLSMAHDREAGFMMQDLVVEALRKQGRKNDLLALVQDTAVDFTVREHAAKALGCQNPHDVIRDIDAEAWRAWLESIEAQNEINQEQGVDLARALRIENAETRLTSGETLEKQGQAEEAAAIYLELAMNTAVGEWIRVEAALKLSKLGRLEQAVQSYVALYHDATTNQMVRKLVSRFLQDMGYDENGVKILPKR